MDARRPSMADSIISRFKIEKNEDGLSIGGTTVLTSHCYLLLFVFAFCFVLAGVVLTFISYRPLTAGDSPDQHLNCMWFGGNTHVAGPVILVIGVLMLVAGICLWTIARKIRRNETLRAQQMGETGLTSPRLKPLSDKPAMDRQRSQSIPTISEKIVEHKRFSLPPIIPANLRCASFIKPASTVHPATNSSYSLLISSKKQGSHMSLHIDEPWQPFAATLSDEPFNSIASLSGTEDIASFPDKSKQEVISLLQSEDTTARA